MDIQETQEAVLMPALARHSGRLSVGHLMAPEEVALATLDGKPRPAEVSGWFVCGELHPEMFLLVKACGIQGQKG